MTELLLQLFITFFTIGLFTFGGGYAVIGIIQSEIVVAKGWITEPVFTDIVAISQMTPGPIGLNCSTYVGYEVLKEAGASELLACTGSLVASLAVVLPSFLIMLLIVRMYAKFHETAVARNMLSGLKPAVAGLIGASALVLMFSFDGGFRIITGNFPDWKAWALAAGAFIAYHFFKRGPMVILAAGALIGLIIY